MVVAQLRGIKMDLNNYLTSQRDINNPDVISEHTFPTVKRITCKDGFSVSVQANHGAYCRPRRNIGPWHEVECGFPSSVPELIMGYAETPESPTETVYGYVPIELVEKLIELHGGIAA
jgi:hypothetical protein